MPQKKIKVLLRNQLQIIEAQCEEEVQDLKAILKAIKRIDGLIDSVLSCPLKADDCPLNETITISNGVKKDKK